MRSYHFSKENLAILNPYKVILKISAAENEKKIDISIMQFPIALNIIQNSWLLLVAKMIVKDWHSSWISWYFLKSKVL